MTQKASHLPTAWEWEAGGEASGLFHRLTSAEPSEILVFLLFCEAQPFAEGNFTSAGASAALGDVQSPLSGERGSPARSLPAKGGC